MTTETLISLLDRIEGYNFECEAGPLRNCVDWQGLKSELAHMHVNSQDGTDRCKSCGHDLRHPVHYAWGELNQIMADFRKATGYTVPEWRKMREEIRSEMNKPLL